MSTLEHPGGPIGVFDSGVGGLTVLKALRNRMPNQDFIYLGDTARLPYGTKSLETVRRYAIQATKQLVQRQVKLIVVACNTASAVALSTIRDTFAPLRVFGVVDPGARAACRISRNGRIAVIATDSTVRGGAYQKAILNYRSDARIVARACPLLVTLAEEGWLYNPARDAIVHAYVHSWLSTDMHADTLLLGCTHFPLLTPAFEKLTAKGISLVDSAETTAAEVSDALGIVAENKVKGKGSVVYLATDDRLRFAIVGRNFLGEAIAESSVELVDL